jgi:eukaryotic-like serine/threonine-protein kinase
VRTFLVDLADGKPKPITPEAIVAAMPSPDGKYVAGRTAEHELVFPLDGGEPVSINFPRGFETARWSEDGKAFYIYRLAEIPMKIYRFEIATGKMTPIRELTPIDRAGVVRIAPVVTNSRASEFAYSYYQTLSVLYVVSGLR